MADIFHYIQPPHTVVSLVVVVEVLVCIHSQHALVLLEPTPGTERCCLPAPSNSVSYHKAARTVSVTDLARSHTHRSLDPAAYPYVTDKQVNTQDYWYRVS